jgi:hypothetical protein
MRNAYYLANQKAWLAKEETVDDRDSTRSTPGTSH